MPSAVNNLFTWEHLLSFLEAFPDSFTWLKALLQSQSSLQTNVAKAIGLLQCTCSAIYTSQLNHKALEGSSITRTTCVFIFISQGPSTTSGTDYVLNKWWDLFISVRNEFGYRWWNTWLKVAWRNKGCSPQITRLLEADSYWDLSVVLSVYWCHQRPWLFQSSPSQSILNTIYSDFCKAREILLKCESDNITPLLTVLTWTFKVPHRVSACFSFLYSTYRCVWHTTSFTIVCEYN